MTAPTSHWILRIARQIREETEQMRREIHNMKTSAQLFEARALPQCLH